MINLFLHLCALMSQLPWSFWYCKREYRTSREPSFERNSQRDVQRY